MEFDNQNVSLKNRMFLFSRRYDKFKVWRMQRTKNRIIIYFLCCVYVAFILFKRSKGGKKILKKKNQIKNGAKLFTNGCEQKKWKYDKEFFATRKRKLLWNSFCRLFKVKRKQHLIWIFSSNWDGYKYELKTKL